MFQVAFSKDAQETNGLLCHGDTGNQRSPMLRTIVQTAVNIDLCVLLKDGLILLPKM